MSVSKIMGISTGSLSKFMGIAKASIQKIGGIFYPSNIAYGIWNPNDKGVNITVSNKNLSATGSGAAWYTVRTTVSKTTGKYYCEMVPSNSNNGEYCIFGIAGSDASLSTYVGNNNYSWGWWGKGSGPRYYHNGSETIITSSFTNNDVIMIALDIDNDKIWFGKNGTWNGSPAGDPANGLYAAYSDLDLASYYFAAALQSGAGVTINCGQIPFSYTPPSGFSAFSGPPSWFTSYNQPSAWTYGTNVASMNFRMLFAGSNLTMSGSKIRLTIAAHNTQSQTLAGVSIGERDGSTINMISTPTRVTFDGGSSSVTISAGVDKVSDEIDFEIDETKSYLIHVHQNEGSSGDYAYRSATNGRYYKNTTDNDTMVQSPSGYSSQISEYTSYIQKIEIYSIVPTSYATWNPSDKSLVTLSNKNLTVVNAHNGYYNGVRATIGKETGKWYWEFTCTGGSDQHVGVVTSNAALEDQGFWVSATGYGYGSYYGKKYNNNTSAAYGDTWTTGDVIGIALDMYNGKIWFSKNGVWQASGDPAAGTNAAYTGLTGTLYPVWDGNGTTDAGTVNFGATAFSYVAPSGFKSGLMSSTEGGYIYGPFTSFNTVNSGWATTTARYIIPTADILKSGTRGKIKLASVAGGAWSFQKCYIGHAAASGDNYDFDGNQVQVLFGGAANGTVPTSGGLTSDEIAFNIDKSKNLIISFYFSGSTSPPRYSAGTGYGLYYKAGDDASTTDATGYSPSGYNGQQHFVEAIIILPV